MFRTLFLIRHAEAEAENNFRDFNRNLTSRGKEDALRTSMRLQNHQSLPQLILSSPATRAINTAKIFVETLEIPFNKVRLENTIYQASSNNLLSLINYIDDKCKVVALVGHNPGISDLMNYLAGDVFGFIPTSGIVQLQMEVASWRLVTEGSAKIVWHTFPNEGF